MAETMQIQILVATRLCIYFVSNRAHVVEILDNARRTALFYRYLRVITESYQLVTAS